MTDPRQIAGDINVYCGYTFEVSLEAQTGSTGYSWALAHMPDSINLVDIRHEISHSGRYGSTTKQIFMFVAIKTDQSYITFNLIRPWAAIDPGDSKTFALIIVEKPKNLEQELEATLGPCTFAATNGNAERPPVNALYMAPLAANYITSSYHQAIPYGVPVNTVEHPEKCLLAYGTPNGIAAKPSDCVLKYGCPIHMIDDSENCGVVKYGFPQQEAANCLVKYGFPVEVKEDADNCVVKYGIPTGVAPNEENCILKYGFPVSASEDTEKCILKYGAPPEPQK